jgi:myosin-crossreactive antigen
MSSMRVLFFFLLTSEQFTQPLRKKFQRYPTKDDAEKKIFYWFYSRLSNRLSEYLSKSMRICHCYQTMIEKQS